MPAAATWLRIAERGLALSAAYFLARKLKRYGFLTTTVYVVGNVCEAASDVGTTLGWVYKTVSASVDAARDQGSQPETSDVVEERDPNRTTPKPLPQAKTRKGIAIALPIKGMSKEEIISTLVKLKYKDHTPVSQMQLTDISPFAQTLRVTNPATSASELPTVADASLVDDRESSVLDTLEAGTADVKASRNLYVRGAATNTGPIVTPSRNLSRSAPRVLHRQNPEYTRNENIGQDDGRVWELYGHGRLNDYHPPPSVLRMESDVVSMLARAFSAPSMDIGGYVTSSAWDVASEVIGCALQNRTNSQCTVVLVGDCHRSWEHVIESLGAQRVCIPVVCGADTSVLLKLRQHLHTDTALVIVNPFTPTYNRLLSKRTGTCTTANLAWMGESCTNLVQSILRVINSAEIPVHVDITEHSMLFPSIPVAVATVQIALNEDHEPNEVEFDESATAKSSTELLSSVANNHRGTMRSLVSESTTGPVVSLGFGVDGVTSLSVCVDSVLSHENTCAVVYRDKSYRPAGTPRPGVTSGSIASAWATMMNFGLEGYSLAANDLVVARARLCESIAEMDELDVSLSYVEALALQVHTTPTMTDTLGATVVNTLDIATIGAQLNARSWLVDFVAEPHPHLSVSVSLAMIPSLEDFLEDLHSIVKKQKMSRKITTGRKPLTATSLGNALRSKHSKRKPSVSQSTVNPNTAASYNPTGSMLNYFSQMVGYGQTDNTAKAGMVHPGKDHLQGNDFVARRLRNVLKGPHGST
ncbi:hypothetical protein SARC_08747 [Sphaeroforma arctica JP610]|uniref:Uncharacterized protein n=1 Tax=Sphaeroforma arctica JP610 TaxID=667725 RepID=A0A0L0FPU4_9EUKA|nr:hypothetical protein SARC_08747 [Sphaeroforma arctica JP610]KNC78830.1 hypothetical protein SARC_08747 [Sphaeroforma arctica JP610]|eukprot:XP_014152732.1 hypothetical protein SARC_08747 [Sphaeroforma arctica JP610]